MDLTEIPDFNTMYELYDPCTVMFFFRNKHIMIDLGTGNNNKINWAMNNKQEFIDIVEVVYRGARKGRGLVVSPKGECIASVRAGFENMCTLETCSLQKSFHCCVCSSLFIIFLLLQITLPSTGINQEKSQIETSSTGRSHGHNTCVTTFRACGLMLHVRHGNKTFITRHLLQTLLPIRTPSISSQ